jgi:hypothetical protein
MPSRAARAPETALYDAVKAFLERQGFEAKGEVCGCDIVAVRGAEAPIVVVTELKLGFSPELVLQGVDRSRTADAGRILLRNVYGWFERVEPGRYRLAERGAAALRHWAQVGDGHLSAAWRLGLGWRHWTGSRSVGCSPLALVAGFPGTAAVTNSARVGWALVYAAAICPWTSARIAKERLRAA